ncbi:PAS domain-containing protein [Parvibaculum sp.]|uniref:PAS domain-containing protein n=1 Tax=Parvibaculum sp. TaxID=2024848 RepID=UPI001B0E2639|nr:PAS domain-containing protein [Parvibaculum sp.]MBO6633926.1 PAS domain-containing protein [Parvibaculum sp.]MBO6678277.1 PAS domain-containing protein [Parvibaculum sp.]MBO6684508.1 PAS domain-containing protein [Parvibaculum sp.]MBO6904586.1 PAS domain-containing protein [Parvibaculum sp.]
MSSFTSDIDGSPLDGSASIELLETPVHEDALFLLNYWNEKRRDRAMPDRSDISPTDFPRLLPNFGIAEVIAGGEDFRFRLYGSELTAMTGLDRTGELFSELKAAPKTLLSDEETRRRWFELARGILAFAQPIFPKAPLRDGRGPKRMMHGIILPLSAGEDGKIGQLVGAGFITRVS